MGLTKHELYDEATNSIAGFAKILGHPARIKILQFIAGSPSCIGQDIVGKLGLAQSTVSQHLKELKNAGLIKGNIESPAMNYCINEKKWAEMTQTLTGFLETNQPQTGGNC